MASPVEHGLVRASWALLRTPVRPGRASWLAFGWLLVLLLALQVVSGVLLSLYYQPSPEMASESVEYVMRDVSWGWLVRGTHHWTSFAMVVTVFAQLVYVFAAGTYRGAAASSWTLGLVMMVAVLSFAFSGQLLTWDAQAYWSIATFLDLVESLPLLGPGLAVLLRGGPEVGPATLSRAYSLHVLLLPWVLTLLLLMHLWLMAQRRRGTR